MMARAVISPRRTDQVVISPKTNRSGPESMCMTQLQQQASPASIFILVHHSTNKVGATDTGSQPYSSTAQIGCGVAAMQMTCRCAKCRSSNGLNRNCQHGKKHAVEERWQSHAYWAKQLGWHPLSALQQCCDIVGSSDVPTHQSCWWNKCLGHGQCTGHNVHHRVRPSKSLVFALQQSMIACAMTML